MGNSEMAPFFWLAPGGANFLLCPPALAQCRSKYLPRCGVVSRPPPAHFCVLRLRQGRRAHSHAIDDVSYTDRIQVSGGRYDMSKMSLPCSLEKLRLEVRLISKQDLTIISGAEIAQYRNKEERKNGTEDNNVPPEDMTDDQTTTIHTNVNARLGTVKPAQRLRLR